MDEAKADEIRGMHPFCFRSGEWAVLWGIARREDRDCYVVRFADGATDEWPVDDRRAEYEFRSSGAGMTTRERAVDPETFYLLVCRECEPHQTPGSAAIPFGSALVRKPLEARVNGQLVLRKDLDAILDAAGPAEAVEKARELLAKIDESMAAPAVQVLHG